jgi:hypothetical protein
MTTSESWVRVAYGRSREDAVRQFVDWKEAMGFTPREEDIQLNLGRHADGGDYWEILHRSRTDRSDQ